MESNKFEVEVKYEYTETGTVRETIEAESADAAEVILIDKINAKDGYKARSATSKHIPYKTEDWQDVEDVIFDYDDCIKEVEAEGDEDDMASMYKEDRADWQYILDQLVAKEFKKAAEKLSDLDTCVRERCPDRVYDLFENLNLI